MVRFQDVLAAMKKGERERKENTINSSRGGLFTQRKQEKYLKYLSKNVTQSESIPVSKPQYTQIVDDTGVTKSPIGQKTQRCGSVCKEGSRTERKTGNQNIHVFSERNRRTIKNENIKVNNYILSELHKELRKVY